MAREHGLERLTRRCGEQVKFLLLCLFLTACTIDTAVRTANAAAELGDRVEAVMATEYKSEQQAVVDSATSLDTGKVALQAVRDRWSSAWKAYTAFRKAWLVLADAINQAKAGKEVDIPTAILNLLEAESFLVKGVP